MADLAYIGTVGADIPRDSFVLYVKLGADYEVLGYGVTSSGVTVTVDSETKNDILGNTIVKNKSITEEQTFDPGDIIVGNKLAAKLIDIQRRRAIDEYNQFTVLRVWGFFGTAGSYEAEQDTNCTIQPSGDVGGEGTMSMPYKVTMSGGANRTFGTTNVVKQTATTKITFTPKAGA